MTVAVTKLLRFNRRERSCNNLILSFETERSTFLLFCAPPLFRFLQSSKRDMIFIAWQSLRLQSVYHCPLVDSFPSTLGLGDCHIILVCYRSLSAIPFLVYENCSVLISLMSWCLKTYLNIGQYTTGTLSCTNFLPFYSNHRAILILVKTPFWVGLLYIRWNPISLFIRPWPPILQFSHNHLLCWFVFILFLSTECFSSLFFTISTWMGLRLAPFQSFRIYSTY